MKMMIGFDEEKIKREDVYTVAQLKEATDEGFRNYTLSDGILQTDGRYLYQGNGDDQDFAHFGLVFLFLTEQKWFVNNCLFWTWDDEAGDNEDVMAQIWDGSVESVWNGEDVLSEIKAKGGNV